MLGFAARKFNPDLLNNTSGECEKPLSDVADYFSADQAVIGIFPSGSMLAGTADQFSDIYLRVTVTL